MTYQKKNKTLSTHILMLILSIFLMASVFVYFKIATSNTVAPYNDKTVIILNSPWKFKTGDNLQWAKPEFNDSAWEIVDLTAPPGARDGDVGISGYIPGWTGKKHPNYFGYAWYRMRLSFDASEFNGQDLALLSPPAVDDVYQLFINGRLMGSIGDFSNSIPTVYSIKPKMFSLPVIKPVNGKREITIAFRVWMSKATLEQGSDLGGIHVAPIIGNESKIQEIYKFQWQQTIMGYIVEVIEPLIFILLALTIFLLHKNRLTKHLQIWFIIALILLGLVRLNQAVYYWFQIETSHQYDIITTVILMPLILGSWLMAWRDWFGLSKPIWIPIAIALLTTCYMLTQLFALSWFIESINHAAFSSASNYLRLLFAFLLLFIIYMKIRKNGWKDWITLLAVLFVSIGLFSREVSLYLHIPGIWFPYGVGVSRTQYVYGIFVVLMYIVLIQKKDKAFVE